MRYQIAWDKACLCVQEGQFVLRGLRLQNKVLLLNSIHKLHQRESFPWKEWFHSSSPRDLGDSSANPSFIEKLSPPASTSTVGVPLGLLETGSPHLSGLIIGFLEACWRVVFQLCSATLLAPMPLLLLFWATVFTSSHASLQWPLLRWGKFGPSLRVLSSPLIRTLG